jgi:hypothetical protein
MRCARLAFGMAVLVAPGNALGWSGDTWAPITRATIKANADQMIDSTWVPKNTFTNYQYGSTYKTYTKGVTYKGIAYSQNNPQENWSQFYNLVTNTAGGSVGYGNDCSGFVSICWKLPARYTTSTFESKLGTYWISLGAIGSSASVPLIMGDAINRASSHIILFLNYEGSGIRSMEQTPDNAQRRLWSYSSLANYRPIRRLEILDAPAISGDGLSRVVDTGKPVTLSISATGTAPLQYQWRFKGANISGATSDRLTISAAQPANAGDYVCVVTNTSGSVTSKVTSLTVYPRQETVFLDTFDTDTQANWTVNKSSSDTRVFFNYDYSSMGIPAAPNATWGSTRGVRMEANISGGAVAALSLSPKIQSFSGDYRLRFDMWINVNGPLPAGGTGSTEFLTGGIGTAGNRVQWTGAGSTADGFWFSVSGEGGAGDTSTSTGDYCGYIGPSLQNPASGFYMAGTDTSAKGNSHSYYIAAFPAGSAPPAWQQANYAQQTGSTAAGTAGLRWREVIIARYGSTVEWSIDGIKLASITNAAATAGNVFIGYWDNYASISDNSNLSFGLVDNVRVEVPVSAPIITAHPEDASVWAGSDASFSVSATGTAPLSYYWRFNGTNLPNTNADTYMRTNAQMVDAGLYSVLVSNIAGVALSSEGMLRVVQPAPPVLEGISTLPEGRLQLKLLCIPGHYAIESSTNLAQWIEVTNFVTSGAITHDMDMDTNAIRKFFRARLVQ